MKTVYVDLNERSYPVHIGPGVRQTLTSVIGKTPGSQVAIVTDSTVGRLHADALRDALPVGVVTLTVPEGEASKSLATLEKLADQLAAARIERGGLIVALGGGMIGDLAGFLAAVWLRGVRFVQVPPALLAAIDASVGGKTGINLKAGKNLVGAFHQPRGVVIDTDFLATLPDRDLIEGLGESVKHACIREPSLLAWHVDHIDAIRRRDAETLAALIARNVAIKSAVVSQDEREAGLREILNYGHTIGHAIELLMGYSLRHGECVALGMIAENAVAVARGILPPETAQEIRSVVERVGLPVRLPRTVDPDEIWRACQVDKKVRDGAVRLMALRSLGDPLAITGVTRDDVAAALAAVATS